MTRTAAAFVTCLLLIEAAFAEIFSSYKEMENLIDLNHKALHVMKSFISRKRDQLDHYDSVVRLLEEDELESGEKEKYAGNPVNQFYLIRKLSRSRQILKQVSDADGQNVFSELEKAYNFPDDGDYSGVIEGIYRLQDTYRLQPSHFGSGNASNNYKAKEFNAADYFEIGLHGFRNEDYYHALPWLLEAERKALSEKVPTADINLVRDYLSFATYKQDNFGHAYNLTLKLLETDDQNERWMGNRDVFQESLEKVNRGENPDVDPTEAMHSIRNKRTGEDFYEKRKYEALCRGEGVMNDVNRFSKLVCRYRHNNKPFLMLQPIKEEEVLDHPKMTMYHDVVNDEEIEVLKRLSEPQLERALIHNPKTSVLEPAQYRISKLCWLTESQHPAVARLSKIMENLMNITMSSAEMLQVQNYGVGGHYEPHFDFSRRSESSIFRDGNRVATWLTYLTDVEYGGATVFPSIGARVLPRKGSAVTWFNMFRSGYGDYRTRHAACPVLFGTKWVANRWMHEHGQEFFRGCTKDPMD